MGCPLFHQTLSHREGHQGSILAEDKQVQRIAGSGGGLHQILVAQGKGVCVHDQGGGKALPLCFLQGIQVALKAVSPVFHEHQSPVHPGDFVKAQAAEKLGRSHLGVQEQMGIAPGVLDLHQMGDDLVQKALPLMILADGKAPQGAAKAAACGDDFILVIPHGADIVQVPVPGDTLPPQQRVDPFQTSFVRGVYLGNGIFTHGLPPSESAADTPWPAGPPYLRGTGFPG